MQTKFLCLLFFVLGAIRSGAQNEVTSRLDALLAEASAKDVFSGNILVFQNGQTLFQKQTGMADHATRAPNTAETRFSIGSVTKLFTKILVLQLASEGKVRLGDKLGQHLDGFRPEVADQVTLAHLLDHQSGLGHYFDLPVFEPEGKTVGSAADFLPWIRQEKLRFTPGSQTEYSNSGYVLLAAVLEKAEGKKYADILKARILDKVGMEATGFSYMQQKLPGKAVGYLSGQPGPLRDNLGFPLLAAGDGGMWSTTGDLLKLDRSLADDNRLLSDADKLRLFDDPLAPRRFSTWAEFRREGRFGIAGGAPGISAVYGRNHAQNRTVIVLSNFDEGSAEEIFRRIGAIFNGDPVAPLQPSASKFIYSLMMEKGAGYFGANIERELQENGYGLDDDMVLLFAGQALLEGGNADEAIALYRFYTEKFPRIVVAWNDLGDAYLLKNDKENARKCFQKALELRPGNQRARENLNKL